jgi:hypothetical protein
MNYFQKIILKFKKPFSSFSFSKKRFVFLFPILAFFLFIPLIIHAQLPIFPSPFQPALPTAIFTVLLAFIIEITGAFALLAGAILDFVTGPNFISLSYTNPAHNKIIEIGLSITQSLVNMFLVLALVYIAVSIALKLAGETEAKKMLVRLIFIALIVNFAPVICGLIIDASNIVMNYFLVGIKEGISSILTNATNLKESFIGFLIKLLTFEGQIVLITKGLVQIALNSAIAFAFLLFSIIFIARYLAIWILVILAPLAFVAWITPVTKRFWNLWWNQLVQWSIVGIPMAFFLYLGSRTFELLRGTYEGKFVVSGEPGLAKFFDNAFPFFLVLIFLYLGFVIGLQTAAMGAPKIISFVKRAGKGAAMWTGRTAVGIARGIPTVSRAEERIRKGLEVAPVIGRVIGGPGAFEREREKNLAMAREEIEKIPDTPEGNEAIRARISRRPLTRSDRYQRAIGIEELARRKDLQDVEADKYIREAQEWGANIKAIYQARPDKASLLIDPQTGRSMTVKQIMDKIMPGDFWRNVQKEAISIRPGMTPQQISQVYEVVLHAALDERKFVQMTRHMKPDLKREFKNTFLSAPPRPLTPQQQNIIRRRITQLSTDPEWQV